MTIEILTIIFISASIYVFYIGTTAGKKGGRWGNDKT